MALSVGLEPTISCLEGKHIIRLCYESCMHQAKINDYNLVKDVFNGIQTLIVL